MDRSFRSIEGGQEPEFESRLSRSPGRAVFRFAAVALALAAGCASNEPVDDQTVPVSGTVLLDGQPLTTGRIVFIDNDGPFPRDYLAEITDGKFEATVSPGRRRVEIRSWKQPEEFPIPKGSGPFPQIIPSRYNDESELSIDVTPGDASPLTFELKSEAK